jgi:hypothetical protein
MPYDQVYLKAAVAGFDCLSDNRLIRSDRYDDGIITYNRKNQGS